MLSSHTMSDQPNIHKTKLKTTTTTRSPSLDVSVPSLYVILLRDGTILSLAPS